MTRRQKEIVDFLRSYIREHGVAPTLDEIGRRLGLASLATVHKHLRALEARGVIRRRARASRALELCDAPGAAAEVARVPFLGRVAAGTPIEAVEVDETIALPADLLGRGACFALEVVGSSMIDAGILDGDVVVVEARADAPDGATVVAVVGGEATVKRLRRSGAEVQLLPANAAMLPIVVPATEVQIRGVVVGLLRRYRR